MRQAPPPPSQPLMRQAPPPPSQPLGPLGPQRAGAFQAYQTAMAAQPPAPPKVVPTAAPMAATMAAQMAPQFAQQLPPPQMTMLADSVPSSAVPAPAKAKATSQSKGKSRRKRRTGLATAMWVLVGAAVIGGGVFAGFQIRDLRLRRQIDAAEKRAIESSSSDTWIGWRTARDGLASIAAARRTIDSRAALARAQAVLAYELGDGAAEASATLRPLGADARTAVARTYMAMIAGDAAAATREVGLISGESASVVEYLRGRAALLSGDPKAAIAALEKSLRADARPFTAVALAEAYAAAERWDDAQKVLDASLARSVDHPALVVARASIADRLGKHTPETSAQDIARLEKVAVEGGKPLASQARGVSRWQAGQALLVEAGLQLRRGEREAAISSIGRALDLGVDEQRLAEGSVQALLAADLSDVAVAGAKRGLTSWPQSMVMRTVLAQGAFAEGHISEVIEALPDALIGKDPMALAVRARAKISVGDLEGARKDLDVVAAASTPELAVARSLLKLASGETIPAAPASPRPDLSLVQAMAARLRGEPAKAVAILEPLARGAMGAERYTIRLELARSYRDVANYSSARAAYADLASLNNPTVRLEGAQLLLEDRDPKGAREHIEALLRDLGDKASGMVLVEAMRIRTLTGAATAAEQLADRAFKAGAPPWMLNREAARIARRRDDFSAAVTALSKALDGSKSDIDTLLLACDLVDGAPAAFVAKVTKAIDERLVGMPDQLVAQGKLAFTRGDRDKAAELFGKAAQRFMEKPAAARRVAQASFGAGALAVDRGDWVTAKLKLEAALELDPSLVDAYLYQAEALASSNALKQAISRLKLASEYSPESAAVWQLLSNRAAEAGDRKTAAAAARRAEALLAKKKPS
jgi:tetratricopeptide (TPR) repeat protein